MSSSSQFIEAENVHCYKYNEIKAPKKKKLDLLNIVDREKEKRTLVCSSNNGKTSKSIILEDQ